MNSLKEILPIMLITEKKIRSIVRKMLLQEAPFDPTDVTKSFNLEKAIDLARKLVVKDSVKNNEKDKKESIKISNSLAAIRDGVPGEPTQRFQTALANLLNFEGPGKEEQEYKDLLKMVRDRLGSQAKKGDGQAEKDSIKKKKKKSDSKIKIIQQQLNNVMRQKKITGDYQNQKLTVDGQWGSRTRSAVSKALFLFAKDEKLRNKYGFKPITGKGLNMKKSGGAGSWKSELSELVKGATPQGESAKKHLGTDTYGNLLYVITKLYEYNQGINVKPEENTGPDDPLKKGYLEKLKEYGSRNNYLYLSNNASNNISSKANQLKGFDLKFIRSRDITNDKIAGGTSVNDKRRKYKNLKAANDSKLFGGGLVKDNKLGRDAKIILSPTDKKEKVDIEGVEIELNIFDVVIDGSLDDNIFIGNYVALPYLPKKHGTDLEKFDGSGVIYYVQLDEYKRRAKKAAENFAKRKKTDAKAQT
jgi:hypothetical protein